MKRGRLRGLGRVARGVRQRSGGRPGRRAERFLARIRFDPDAPELLLSPHWDDAVLDCWSVLASGRQLAVVNVFAGLPAEGRRTAWEEVIGVRDTAERARRRLAEDAGALARTGREAINLPLLGLAHRRPHQLQLEDIDRFLCGAVPQA